MHDLPLVDQHCHAIRLDELDTGAFEALCSESPYPAGNGSHLDGPVGFAIRRWCPPVLDLEPFCSWDIYLARRAQLGAVEVSRRLLRAAGHELLLVDTGYRGDELCSLADLSTLAGTPTREIVRIEVVAEELAEAMRAVDAADDLRAEDFLASFERRLRERCATAVGMKSILAYRCGFDLDLVGGNLAGARVSPALAAAVPTWLAAGGQLDDPAIEAAIIGVAARLSGELGLPLQFHVGYGDPDVVLHRSNPSLLTSFIEWCRPIGTRIVLLHCWPFEREAGFLATVYPHVWMDVGLSMNYLGPSAPAFFFRALECAPWPKVLYSSDAFGLAELYLAGAQQFRWALGQVLDDWVGAGSVPAGEVGHIATGIAGRNARALYRL